MPDGSGQEHDCGRNAECDLAGFSRRSLDKLHSQETKGYGNTVGLYVHQPSWWHSTGAGEFSFLSHSGFAFAVALQMFAYAYLHIMSVLATYVPVPE